MPTKTLTTTDFKTEIFDYTVEKDWKYKGDRPAVIDFYADWCAPCKMIAPILEELSEKYADEITIYKVNTEEEEELAHVFNIRSIPSLLFIPLEGTPSMQAGALPKPGLIEAIETVLLNKKVD